MCVDLSSLPVMDIDTTYPSLTITLNLPPSTSCRGKMRYMRNSKPTKHGFGISPSKSFKAIKEGSTNQMIWNDSWLTKGFNLCHWLHIHWNRIQLPSDSIAHWWRECELFSNMLACLFLSGLTQQWSWSSFSINLQSSYWRIDLLTRCSMARNLILVWFSFSGATDMSCNQSDTKQGGRQQQKPISWFTLDHLSLLSDMKCKDSYLANIECLMWTTYHLHFIYNTGEGTV